MPPATLHACRESRDEALKRYKVLFDPAKTIKPMTKRGKTSTNKKIKASSLPVVYINPEIDMVHFEVQNLADSLPNLTWAGDDVVYPDCESIEDLLQNCVVKITHLLVETRTMGIRWAKAGEFKFQEQLLRFRDLHTITILSKFPLGHYCLPLFCDKALRSIQIEENDIEAFRRLLIDFGEEMRDHDKEAFRQGWWPLEVELEGTDNDGSEWAPHVEHRYLI